MNAQNGGTVPQPVPDALERLRALHRAMSAGLVESCHDCSEGGIGVALAEMCIAGRLGATLWLDRVPGIAPSTPDEVILFSESLSRFIVEVSAEHEPSFNAMMDGVPCARIGSVDDGGALTIGRAVSDEREPGKRANISVETLEMAWRGVIGEGLSTPTSAPPPVARRAQSPTPRPAPPTVAQTAVRGPARVLILHTAGTNRDRDAGLACEAAGAAPEIVRVGQLLSGERCLEDYHMLVVPGGFSYGDDLGAGKLWALDLQHRMADMVSQFILSGRPVLGICNGFQALVKSGLLPGPDWAQEQGAAPGRPVTLTHNATARFECRWV